MNSGGESLFLPNDLAVQRARKMGYKKGWDDRRILNERVMDGALWESVTYGELMRNMRSESPEAREKIE